MLDQNWIRYFFRSIGYPIVFLTKIYEDKKSKIRIVLIDIITPQARSINVLITALHELHPRKTLEMVDKKSNMQLADLNSKPHVGKSRRNIIDLDMGALFCHPPGSLHHRIFLQDQFHGPTHINCKQNNKSEIKISSARNRATKSCADQI